MDLREFIDTDLINLELGTKTKEDTIDALASLMVEKGYVHEKEDYVHEVLEREKRGLTGIGQSIAIPHGKSASVTRTCIAIGRTSNDLEWEAPDQRPVRIVLLFAVEEKHQNTTHLRLLAAIASALADEELCRGLLTATTKEKVISLFQDKQFEK
ncbi:PTS system, fructose subfamily, IIA component [Paenibacillus larvae subsp. larvae]|uniref:PTS system, fructose subfamily, IIA component n=1 Tax=Paenibacillus larvae subsp. larvae TaxID=147375 RepID=A0A2L1UAK2_9BACL|nr:PTS sugar transporter subunit IIA [Paenibacillus larvae]AQT85771.1 hypothetical protein B1222_17285 [Paenibacillus larvae subsp. pulvifaciens]AQZ46002.1 hypothetical protein B5S25_04670 [Paenibacillus larvae subsp. pulvifaciens]AVF25175.1 PTS system, fructose subfamily, IIA component [Paenibacillus larvae subsp. larvae]AVF29951.1 PTS system, fructose subfamily, IIA component [Paenibacillus larvae subsp. larvae]MBH0342249.1 hypothetical protein [Paenibacillus larvae]